MPGRPTTQPVVVQVLQVPDCPLVEGVRALVQESARSLGLEVEVADIVGDYSSPTVVIDGRDVTVTHEHLPSMGMYGGISRGWPAVLANLKSLLETGKSLPAEVWDLMPAEQSWQA